MINKNKTLFWYPEINNKLQNVKMEYLNKILIQVRHKIIALINQTKALIFHFLEIKIIYKMIFKIPSQTIRCLELILHNKLSTQMRRVFLKNLKKSLNLMVNIQTLQLFGTNIIKMFKINFLIFLNKMNKLNKMMTVFYKK